MLGGGLAHGMAHAQRWHARHRHPFRYVHVAYETTCDVVGIRQPNRTLLGENGQVQWEVGRLQASSEALVEEAPQTAAAMSGEQGLDRTLA